MIDPLALVFIPGAAACIAVFTTPVILGARWVGLRRAAKRNRACCCGRCGRKFVRGGGDIFVAEGVFICEACACRARRRLSWFIPASVTLTAGLGLSAAAGFFLSRPGLEWWLDSRWIPLLLPSVGLGLGTWVSLRLAKHRNALSNRLEEGTGATLRDADVDALLAASPVGDLLRNESRAIGAKREEASAHGA